MHHSTTNTLKRRYFIIKVYLNALFTRISTKAIIYLQ